MNENTLDRLREPLFVVAFFGGMLVFATGIAFLILGLTVNTEPPAPYMDTADKYMLTVVSLVVAIAGGATVRFAGRVVGW